MEGGGCCDAGLACGVPVIGTGESCVVGGGGGVRRQCCQA